MADDYKVQIEKEKRLDEDRKRRAQTSNYTSADSLVDSAATFVCRCSCCSTYAMVLAVPLEGLPRRATDGALVLAAADVLPASQKVTALPEIHIRRAAGIEKQWRSSCTQCGLLLYYRCEDEERLFLARDALKTDAEKISESGQKKTSAANVPGGAGYVPKTVVVRPGL